LERDGLLTFPLDFAKTVGQTGVNGAQQLWDLVREAMPLEAKSDPEGLFGNKLPRGWDPIFANCTLNVAAYQAGYNEDVDVGDQRRKQFAVPRPEGFSSSDDTGKKTSAIGKEKARAQDKKAKEKEEKQKKVKEAREKLYNFLLVVLTCSCFGWLDENEELEVKEVNILFSDPQCQEQRKHHDMEFQFGNPDSSYGRWYSAIIPLQQCGGLVVWPGSHHHVRAGAEAEHVCLQTQEEYNKADEDGRVISKAWQIYKKILEGMRVTPAMNTVVERSEILLGSEECIVFDSLLLHAGARSVRRPGSSGSYRLHAYFRVGRKGNAPLTKEKNSTFNVNKFAWRATSPCGCKSCQG
jgi:hypothetical protein